MMNSETEKRQVCTISNTQSHSEIIKSKINVKILKHYCKQTTACEANLRINLISTGEWHKAM